MEENQPTLDPNTNTGLIAVDPAPTDWVFGAESGISATTLLPDGDWRPYLPTGEWQKLMGVSSNGGNGFETDACVTFSALNDLETFLNFQIKHDMLPADALEFLKENGYFDANGSINFSDRFTAVMSSTTTNGNTMPRVWDSIRNDGLVPEAAWPFPVTEIKANPSQAWVYYYATPPQSVRDLGQEFRKHFLVQYEWVAFPGSNYTHDYLRQQLMVSPLHIATAVCPPWNTDQTLAACGMGAAHATMMSHIEADSRYDIFDHYVPFQKQFAPDYGIMYAIRGLITAKQAPISPTTYPAPSNFTHKFTLSLDLGANNPEVMFLQDALKVDGDFPTTVKSTGYFGKVTQIAVQKFQKKYGIVYAGTPTTTGYGRVGVHTMVKLNQIFDK